MHVYSAELPSVKFMRLDADVSKMMVFALKTRNCVLKTRNCALKMMSVCRSTRP